MFQTVTEPAGNMSNSIIAVTPYMSGCILFLWSIREDAFMLLKYRKTLLVGSFG